jgi:replicative DNA helicase
MTDFFTHETIPPTGDPAAGPYRVRLGDLGAAWDAEAEAAHRARLMGSRRGAATGLPSLDARFGGALSPGLHVLHGQPGAGKSALGLQIAATCGSPALYVSSEMGLLELARRVVARVTGTYLGRLRTGELSPPTARALFDQACTAAPDLSLADATQAFASPAWLQEAARVTRGAAPHLLIVIDSVHSWAMAAPVNGTEYEVLNAGLASLRALTAQLQCPILIIAERNRQSMQSGGLSAGAGTRKLEYGAESVLDLTRDPEAVTDAAGEWEITLKLEKNRNGEPGRPVRLKFHGALQRFREA